MVKCYYCNDEVYDCYSGTCDMKCEKRIMSCGNCVMERLNWVICNCCILTCSHCGETDIDEFEHQSYQTCLSCFNISCKKCNIRSSKHNTCKDCENL